jgi:hypothetical protein
MAETVTTSIKIEIEIEIEIERGNKRKANLSSQLDVDCRGDGEGNLHLPFGLGWEEQKKPLFDEKQGERGQDFERENGDGEKRDRGKNLIYMHIFINQYLLRHINVTKIIS